MANVHFNSLVTAEIVEVEFLAADGRTTSLILLVDSGFTGTSGFVLPEDRLLSLGRVRTRDAQAAGALQGSQSRAWVIWRIPSLGIKQTNIAIFSDTTPLALPINVDGIVGLSFLRNFDRWGSKRSRKGAWRFILTLR